MPLRASAKRQKCETRGSTNTHHDLEPVEATSLGRLDFTTEALDEILVHDSIRGGKESKDMFNEMFLVLVQLVVPIMHVL